MFGESEKVETKGTGVRGDPSADRRQSTSFATAPRASHVLLQIIQRAWDHADAVDSHLTCDVSFVTA